jgi:uncharacterized protein (DUF1800 family)
MDAGANSAAGSSLLPRRLLSRTATGVAITALTGGVLAEAPAEATVVPTRRRRRRRRRRAPLSPVLDARSRHILNRFTGGWKPALAAEVKTAGGIDRWFARQLAPTAISDAFYTGSAAWWPSNTATATELWARDRAGTERLWVANANYERWSMLRRIFSQRQVVETMANFWEHHLHAPGEADGVALFRADYGRMLRRNALGRFDTLLQQAITHPAMGVYLGNAVSTKRAPNENLGRELLELHTVGRAAGYTEADVKSSARILTGYRVDQWKTWDVYYDPNSHWTGPVTVLGFSHANANADGRAVTEAYLRYLAHHPSTARTIARKLAVRFVSDAPSDGLVAHLAQVYLANGTAIVPVLKALVASTEFARSSGAKMRTPDEDLVATYRALGVRVGRPTTGESTANAMLWQTQGIGMRPFGWTRPDGRPDRADAWSSVSRMLNSFDVHQTMSGGWWPKKDAVYLRPVQWLPQSRVRFDRLVNHMSRKILGRTASALLQSAASQATGYGAATVITRDHPLVRWQMPRLITVFLDSPTHFTR